MQDDQCRGYGTTDGNIFEKPPLGGHGCAKAASHGTAASSRSYPQESGGPVDNARARSQATQRPNLHDDRLPRFKTGDRVAAFDKTGNRIHGTVRWVGMIDKVQHFVVGIETVSSVVFSHVSGSTFTLFMYTAGTSLSQDMYVSKARVELGNEAMQVSSNIFIY